MQIKLQGAVFPPDRQKPQGRAEARLCPPRGLAVAGRTLPAQEASPGARGATGSASKAEIEPCICMCRV